MSVLAVAAGDRDSEIRQVVAGGSATLEAMAREDVALALAKQLETALGGFAPPAL